VFRTGSEILNNVIGTITEGNVVWEKEFQVLPLTGYYPSVRMNKDGDTILCYHTSFYTIKCVYGKMDGNAMVWMEETRNESEGRYPSVAFTDGLAFLTHEENAIAARL